MNKHFALLRSPYRDSQEIGNSGFWEVSDQNIALPQLMLYLLSRLQLVHHEKKICLGWQHAETYVHKLHREPFSTVYDLLTCRIEIGEVTDCGFCPCEGKPI